MGGPWHMRKATSGPPLADVTVLRVGASVASRLCARTLSGRGALVHHADDLATWYESPEARFCRPDIVLTSSDGEGAASALAGVMSAAGSVVCDMSTFGRTGSLRRAYLDDPDLQRYSSFATYTGFPGGQALCAPGYPIDCQSALYAAAGAIAGLLMRRRDGAGRMVDIARLDVAVNALLTFLPASLAGRAQTRIGNRHPALAPWNIYPARDGWITICAPTDRQWTRLSALIAADIPHDPELLATSQNRLDNIEQLDALIASWTQGKLTEDCLTALMDNGVPCGDIPAEQIRETVSPVDLPAGSSACAVDAYRLEGGPNPVAAPSPLKGVTVVEIGANTTAPLAAKHLGAQVIKVEAPGGDPARHGGISHTDGNSVIFHLTNTDKCDIRLDLRSAAGQRDLGMLLRGANAVDGLPVDRRFHLRPARRPDGVGARAGPHLQAAGCQIDLSMHDRVVWMTAGANRIAENLPGRRSHEGLLDPVQRSGTGACGSTTLSDVLSLPHVEHRGLVKQIGGGNRRLSVLETPCGYAVRRAT